MVTMCPACGKEFEALYSDLWAYRVGSQLLCSWSCLNEYKKAKNEGRKCWMLPEDMKEKAIQTAIDGGDPYDVLRPYTKNVKAMWTAIKANLRKKDPERAKLVPDLRLKKAAEKKEEPEKAPEAVTVKEAEAPKKMKITKPVNYDGFDVCAVKGIFGSYHYQEINGKKWFDFDDNEGSNELSMTVDQWKCFLEEVHNAALILGVEL